MTKTPTAPRVRAVNLYTVESNGQPVAQAMAISQAEAVRLYIESVQQPTMTARLSSPLEARTLAGLPLLQREPAATDTKTADLFEDVPAAPVSPVVGALSDAPMTAPISRDAVEHLQACGVNIVAVDHVEDILAMVPPQHAPIAAVLEGLVSGAQEPAAEQPGEPAGCLDDAPTAAEPAGACSAVADEPTHAERMASAYAAGVELGKQGAHRWGAEFLDADATCTDGLTSGKRIDEIGAELRRGFEFGRASIAPRAQATELKRQAEASAARAGGKIVAKYRDPATGQTWSGRGLKPKWLLAAIEAGRTQDEFLIEGAQA